MAQITQGNRLYLYQLLSTELGISKQTKLEVVEQTLADDDVYPGDLDCADVRELVEALDGICRVTVFKRGRVYVTVLRNAELDSFLAAPEEDATPQPRRAQGRKAWKQKRAPKIPKPAKPKPKNRPTMVEEPEQADPEPVVASPEEQPSIPVAPAMAAEPEALPQSLTEPAADTAGPSNETTADNEGTKSSRETEVTPATEDLPRTVAATPEAAGIATIPDDPVTETPQETDAAPRPEQPEAQDDEAADAAVPDEATQVAVPMDTTTAASDPAATDSAVVSKPSEPAPQAASDDTDERLAPDEPEATPVEPAESDDTPLFTAGAHTNIRLVAMPADKNVSVPAVQRIFPDNFALDVRFENDQLAALYSILPFDVDPMALLDEDWRFSESIESYTYEDARLRFPLRYLRAKDEPVEVTLRRVAPGPSGKRWLLEEVSVGDEVGLWGLPVADEGAWSHLSDAWRRPHMLVSPRREFARFAHLGQAQVFLESLAQMAAEEWWGDGFTVLADYLSLTFWRIMRQGKISVSLDGRNAAFDTGLLAKDGLPILMHFTERPGKVPWTFECFDTDTRGHLTEPATYVEDLAHITLVAGSGVRLSREALRSHGDALTGLVERAVTNAVRNHRVATPAFDPQTDEMRLLIPLRQQDGSVLALVLAPDAVTGYIALSVMTREAAYACARVVSAEQPSWLRPAWSESHQQG